MTDHDLCNDIIIAHEENAKKMQRRIDELESGACRFNCRTAKDAFMAGYDEGYHDCYFGLEDPAPHAAYEEWSKSE